MDTPENLAIVNIFFEYDIRAIFDYRSVLSWLDNIVQEEKVANFFHPKREIADYRIIRSNLMKVVDKYFTWDYSKYEDPIDQYIYICGNWEKIIDEIFKNVNYLEFIPININSKINRYPKQSIIYTNIGIHLGLKKLSKKLLEKGLKHKFTPKERPNDKYLEDII